MAVNYVEIAITNLDHLDSMVDLKDGEIMEIPHGYAGNVFFFFFFLFSII